MKSRLDHVHHSLLRNVLLLQLKLLLGALRDFLLSPLSLGAAALDFALSKNQPPRYLKMVLRLGERSDEWIDLWSGARDGETDARPNVDALMARVEEVLRDPESGVRRTRVLKRWAQRQVSRARQRMDTDKQLANPLDRERAVK
jgi:hypothetical protein